MKKLLFILSPFFFLNCVAQEKPLSQQIAATIMNTWKDSFSLDNKAAKWTYDMGVILKGMEGLWLNTGDVKYFNYIQKQMDFFVKDDGTIKTYKPDEYNIDHINNGKILLTLYRVTLKEKYLKAAKLLRQQLQTHPRTKEGSFWHKKIYPYQVWLDGLYMAQPFYAEYAMLAHEDSAFNDIADQFIRIEKQTRDPKTGLLYHAYDESRQMKWANKETGLSPLFWARAMGWFATALVDVLDYFPEDHPKRKDLIGILTRLIDSIEKVQDKETGLWYDVLAYNGPGKEKNYFEASASSQFIYTIAKASRKGYVPIKKMLIAAKGFKGIAYKYLDRKNGQANLQGTVKVSGLGGNPYRDGSFEYYMSEPVIVNDPKGLGAFLLASNEIESAKPVLGKEKIDVQDFYGKTVLMDNYFNRETKEDAFGHNIVWHYKWRERDNGGFHFLGHQFHKRGVKTKLLDEGPTEKNLKDASVYFIVDPDVPKENKTPSYIEQKHIDAIYEYVKDGGVLVLMGNDSGNAEFKNFNKLAERFGIRFNENLRRDVIDNKFGQGAIRLTDAEIFISKPKAFVKQVSSLTINRPATAVYTENGEVLIAKSKVGKGTVFAIGDPWLYNEYVDGRKLPAKYENFKAAEDLVKWLLMRSK